MNAKLSYAYASQNALLVDDCERNVLYVCESTPRRAIAEVMRKHGVFQLRHISKSELDKRIHNSYTSTGDAASVVHAAQDDMDLSLLVQEVQGTQDLLASTDDAPVIRILNALLLEAAKKGASDIHIEPYETYSCVRARIDGELQEMAKPMRELHRALISRLKIMASLDIAETRLPQDGRISTKLGSKLIDLRVSTIPSAHGERAVLRLLDKSSGKLTLESAGMKAALVQQLDSLIQKPYGLILVTGPTGSGKTTTLYSLLKRLEASKVNIMTVEDPIEYELSGIAQSQVNAKIGYGFAEALRSILRQDPDVVMVGEIRDSETAQIAIQASLTGHLVIATLHTNDSASAVTRLVDMGVEPFLLSSSLLAVLAQRLVRKCDPSDPEKIKGRTGIYELLCSDETIKKLITNKASDTEIREAAKKAGTISMHEYGMQLVQEKITTKAEIYLATSAA